MPTLTLKNVPAELHRRLKAQAARNRRSLNAEAIVSLERALALGPPSAEAEQRLADRISTLHDGLSFQLTEDEITAMIRADRDSR